MYKVIVTALCKPLLSALAFSLTVICSAYATQAEDYFDFIESECLATLSVNFNAVCTTAFDIPSSDPAQVINYGATSNNSSLKQSVDEHLEDRKEDKSRTPLGIGLLVSQQTADTDRATTDLESGFNAETDSDIFGIDYSFTDNILLGILHSTTDDSATIVNNGGELNTESDALLIYGSFTVYDNISLDFYSGNIDSDYRSIRNYEIQNLSGTANGDYSGEQSVHGITVYADWAFNGFSIGASVGIDASTTDIDAYNETGTAGFEIIFPAQEIESETQTVSINSSYQFDVNWGQIIPVISYSQIKEKKNAARSIDTSLVLSPTSSFTFQTDAPDRNYTLTSVGVNVALNNGLLFFVNHESQSGHDFIDTDATAVGVLYAF